MTLFTILLGISLSLTFAFGSAATYRIGEQKGYAKGYRQAQTEIVIEEFVKQENGDWKKLDK